MITPVLPIGTKQNHTYLLLRCLMSRTDCLSLIFSLSIVRDEEDLWNLSVENSQFALGDELVGATIKT